jgi:hypothetical protein
MGYIDPALFGVLSQLGVVFLFVLVSAITFFRRRLTKLINKLVARVRRMSRKRQTDDPDGVRTEGQDPSIE